jgi:hypothetical protein
MTASHPHIEPTSGRPDELLRWAGIDRSRIAAAAARDLLEQPPADNGRRRQRMRDWMTRT